MNVNNNLSSIMAHQNLQNNSAHNVANANTKNFERIDTQITQATNDTVKADTRIQENPYENSNTNMVKEMTDQVLAYQVVNGNVATIKAKDDMERKLIDIKA